MIKKMSLAVDNQKCSRPRHFLTDLLILSNEAGQSRIQLLGVNSYLQPSAASGEKRHFEKPDTADYQELKKKKGKKV